MRLISVDANAPDRSATIRMSVTDVYRLSEVLTDMKSLMQDTVDQYLDLSVFCRDFLEVCELKDAAVMLSTDVVTELKKQ